MNKGKAFFPKGRQKIEDSSGQGSKIKRYTTQHTCTHTHAHSPARARTRSPHSGSHLIATDRMTSDYTQEVYNLIINKRFIINKRLITSCMITHKRILDLMRP
jgi:hypothetical protein